MANTASAENTAMRLDTCAMIVSLFCLRRSELVIMMPHRVSVCDFTRETSELMRVP